MRESSENTQEQSTDSMYKRLIEELGKIGEDYSNEKNNNQSSCEESIKTITEFINRINEALRNKTSGMTEEEKNKLREIYSLLTTLKQKMENHQSKAGKNSDVVNQHRRLDKNIKSIEHTITDILKRYMDVAEKKGTNIDIRV